MSLHLRLTVAHGLLMVAVFFFFPSLSYAAPVEVPETTVGTRDSDDNGNHAINPGMIAGLSFAVLFGMSIVFTAVRASIDRRRLLKAKSGIPRPVASTAPNAPLLVAAADIAVQEPLPAYKAEEPVKMTAEEVEYHSIMATRTTRPPSYSSTTGTLRDYSFNYASSDASSR